MKFFSLIQNGFLGRIEMLLFSSESAKGFYIYTILYIFFKVDLNFEIQDLQVDSNENFQLTHSIFSIYVFFFRKKS